MAKVTKNIKAFSPTVQRTDGLTRNKHARIAPVSHMKPGGNSVETTLGNPQAEKKQMKDLIKTLRSECPIHSIP